MFRFLKRYGKSFILNHSEDIKKPSFNLRGLSKRNIFPFLLLYNPPPPDGFIVTIICVVPPPEAAAKLYVVVKPFGEIVGVGLVGEVPVFVCVRVKLTVAPPKRLPCTIHVVGLGEDPAVQVAPFGKLGGAIDITTWLFAFAEVPFCTTIVAFPGFLSPELAGGMVTSISE
jgi:hypothetical protein